MRRPIAVTTVVVVTLLVTGLATSAGGDGAQLALPATDLRLQGVVTAVFVLAVVVAILSLAFAEPGVVGGQHLRGRRSLLSTLAVVLLAVLVAAVLSTLRGDGGRDQAPAADAIAAQTDAAPDDVIVEPGRAATALATLLAVGALVALAARTQRRRVDDRPPIDADGLRSAVRGGRSVLDRTAADGPREAILACWRALEAELTALDRPRRENETGDEYLRRALSPLGPPPGAVARLAGRVELARWSTVPLDGRDVTTARHALDEVLGGLVQGPAR